MKDAFDVLMITHAGLCKGYADALKLILVEKTDRGCKSPAGTGNHGNEEERYDMGGAGPR